MEFAIGRLGEFRGCLFRCFSARGLIFRAGKRAGNLTSNLTFIH